MIASGLSALLEPPGPVDTISRTTAYIVPLTTRPNRAGSLVSSILKRIDFPGSCHPTRPQKNLQSCSRIFKLLTPLMGIHRFYTPNLHQAENNLVLRGVVPQYIVTAMGLPV